MPVLSAMPDLMINSVDPAGEGKGCVRVQCASVN